jgi:hypothetical protein
MNPNELYGYLDIDKEAVTGFSIFFSRFEYSLKRTLGYALVRNNGVEADWNKFAKDHSAAFDTKRTPQLHEAVEYLLSQPPLKQILNDGTLDWKHTQAQRVSLLQRLTESVRRVRNNLFHGGKFPNVDVQDPGRNETLIKSCIAVLEECLLLNGDVYERFHQKNN